MIHLFLHSNFFQCDLLMNLNKIEMVSEDCWWVIYKCRKLRNRREDVAKITKLLKIPISLPQNIILTD